MNLTKIIENSWNRVIELYFQKGRISYERQLQSYLFLELSNFSNEFTIWIEPTIFLEIGHPLDGKQPDIVITNRYNKIVAIIELKCKPWGHVVYQEDLIKLKNLEVLALKRSKLPLSWPPMHQTWNLQQKNSEVLYEFNPDCLMVFAVIAKYNASAVQHLNCGIKNFIHLTHSIEI